MMDKEKQLPESTNLDDEINTAIAEAEYISKEQPVSSFDQFFRNGAFLFILYYRRVRLV